MSFVFFVAPIHAPVLYPPAMPLPVVYAPVNNVTYRFPIPLLYSSPPPAVL